MFILIVSSSYAPASNGQAVFSTNLAEGMTRRGHEVWLLTASDTGNPYQTERNGVHIQNVRALDFGFFHTESYAALLPDWEVRKFLEKYKPDIVHLQEHYPLAVSVMKAARRMRKKVIGTNHFMPENLAPYIPLLPKMKSLFNRTLWWWMEWTFNSLDVVTAPSETTVKIMCSQGVRGPILPISCGVNLDRFHPDPAVDRQALRMRYGLDPDKTLFLYVGRVVVEKRLDVLIRAIKMLGRQDIQLVISGKGTALAGYQALADELGVKDQVVFTGFIPASDLPALLNSVELFAMPSEAELLSIASLEAMASGLPLLAARSKALPELVTEGVNGYLFNPGDVVDASRWMALLADHPEHWARMGAASLEKVKPHGLENVLTRYEELYFKCISGGSKN